MFKKLLCISAAFVLCLSSFIIPSFADSYNFPLLNYGDTTDAPLNQLDTFGTAIFGFDYAHNPDNPCTRYYISRTNVNVYMFSSNNKVYFASLDSATLSNAAYYDLTGSRQGTQASVLLNNSYTIDDTVFRYTYSDTYDRIYLTMPNFNTYTEGLTALLDFINNPPSTDPTYNDLPDFNIQRGYAAYIDFGSDWSTRSCSGTLTSTFPQYSSLISGDWDGTDNRRYFWTDSLPTNTSFSSNVGNAIDWTKVAPYDLLQRSKNGIWFIQSNSPLNRYLVIVNPNQWRYGQNPTEDTLNSAIKVSDLSGSTGDVKFFALNQQFDQTGTLVSSASDNASNNRTGTYDPDTNTWSSTDSSGNSADQVPGGMSDTPVISSITDYISNITSILSNFANSVISLIQAPISHVAQLIEAGSGFMGALRGLYGWLPVDIQGLVISALTVVIGIGVFKVFL